MATALPCVEDRWGVGLDEYRNKVYFNWDDPKTIVVSVKTQLRLKRRDGLRYVLTRDDADRIAKPLNRLLNAQGRSEDQVVEDQRTLRKIFEQFPEWLAGNIQAKLTGHLAFRVVYLPVYLPYDDDKNDGY